MQVKYAILRPALYFLKVGFFFFLPRNIVQKPYHHRLEIVFLIEYLASNRDLYYLCTGVIILFTRK